MKKISLARFHSVPRKLNLGISKAREVNEDFNKLKEQTARNQRELQETVELLRKVSQQYQELESAYYALLRLITEILPKQEMLLQSYELVQKTKQDLEEALRKHGVECFSPIVGDSVPRDKCKVMGYTGTDKFFSGSVAKVITKGWWIRKNGVVLVFPTVVESVAPSGKEPVSEKTANIEAPDAKERNKGGQQWVS